MLILEGKFIEEAIAKDPTNGTTLTYSSSNKVITKTWIITTLTLISYVTPLKTTFKIITNSVEVEIYRFS